MKEIVLHFETRRDPWGPLYLICKIDTVDGVSLSQPAWGYGYVDEGDSHNYKAFADALYHALLDLFDLEDECSAG